MTSTSNPMRAGFSLLEALAALAILAFVLSISVAGLRSASPALILERRFAELAEAAAALRHEAILKGEFRLLDVTELSCNPARDTWTFSPAGTAGGPPVCLTNDTVSLRLELDGLTGRVSKVVP